MPKKKVTKHDLKENKMVEWAKEIIKYGRAHEKQVKHISYGAIGAIILFFIGQAYVQGVKKDAQDDFSQAMMIYEKGGQDEKSYQQAEKLFKKIQGYSLARISKLALLYEGNCAYRLKNYDGAISSFSKFAKKFPGHRLAPIALESLAKSYEAKEDYKEAANTYEKLSKNYPDSEDISFSLARVYKKSSRLKEAKEIYDRIAKKDPDSDQAKEAELLLSLMEKKEKKPKEQ